MRLRSIVKRLRLFASAKIRVTTDFLDEPVQLVPQITKELLLQVARLVHATPTLHFILIKSLFQIRA